MKKSAVIVAGMSRVVVYNYQWSENFLSEVEEHYIVFLAGLIGSDPNCFNDFIYCKTSSGKDNQRKDFAALVSE